MVVRSAGSMWEWLELGDPARSAWRRDALCAQTDPETFFPEKGRSARDAKRICQGCPVREACSADALERGERFGVWGGLTEQERRPQRQRRRKAQRDAA